MADGEGSGRKHANRPAGDARTAVAEQPQAVSVDRRRGVLVTGAAGLVGTHTCRELSRRGWRIRALVRSPGKAAARLAHLPPPLELRVGDLRDPGVVAAALDGMGAVVHLAAIAIEKRGETYETINTGATRNLVAAARDAGVERFVHMSQNGAASASRFRFLRSKGVAEELVMQSDRKWTVLRPSMIFGREDAFTTVVARLVRLTPWVFPLPGGGRARLQPVAASDVARAIALCLERPGTIGGRYGIGGPAVLTLREMSERILIAMHASRRVVAVPVALLTPLVALLERILPNPPATTSLLRLLELDNVVAENTLRDVFGIVPVPFAPEELFYLRRTTLRDALAWVVGR